MNGEVTGSSSISYKHVTLVLGMTEKLMIIGTTHQESANFFFLSSLIPLYSRQLFIS